MPAACGGTRLPSSLKVKGGCMQACRTDAILMQTMTCRAPPTPPTPTFYLSRYLGI